jgi:hypothetical protein
MKYEAWLAADETTKESLRAQWNGYADGYWHSLVLEASNRFRAEFGTNKHIISVNQGVYHCGVLIIGVHTDLPYPEKVELPEAYAGFPVYQFGAVQLGVQRDGAVPPV